MSQAPTLPRVGDLLAEKYRVLRVVADGGMGVVFEAHHELLDKSVALKFPLPELAQLPSVADRFLAEARLCARVENEHVIRILDVSKLHGLPYIVMEFVSGTSLAAHLGRPWSPPKAAAFATQVLEGLEAVHALGVVHRDVKPDNVLVVETPRGPILKLIDFGIAKDSIPQETIKRLTRAGALLGTPAYMAPEQIQDPLHADHVADLYSVGVLLFEMIAGTSPFRSTGAGDLAREALSGQLKSLLEMAPNTPQQLVGIVSRATALHPQDRFQSAGEFKRALVPFLEGWSADATEAPILPSNGHELQKTEPGTVDMNLDALGTNTIPQTLFTAAVAGSPGVRVASPQAPAAPVTARRPTRRVARAAAFTVCGILVLVGLVLAIAAKRKGREASEGYPAFVPVEASARVTELSPLDSVTPAPASNAAAVVDRWNEAHNRHDVDSLRDLYADNVEFYGQRFALEKVLATKAQLFGRFADFKQEIQDPTYSDNGGRTRATFKKTWLSGGKTNSVGAAVAVAFVGGRLRIVEETDDSVRQVSIGCGDEHCGKVCCATFQKYHCAESAEQCETATNGEGTFFLCDGPEDCGAGKVCCVDPGDRTRVVACTAADACTGSYLHPRYEIEMPRLVVCHSDSDCEAGKHCVATPDLVLRSCDGGPQARAELAAKVKQAEEGARLIRATAQRWRAAMPFDACPSVAQLEEAGVTAASLSDPWGQTYGLQCSGRNVIVSSKGPDGESGTADDIVIAN